MKPILQATVIIAIVSGVLAAAGCDVQSTNTVSNSNSAANSNVNRAVTSNANSAVPPASSAPAVKGESDWALTLPVLDAFLTDEEFVSEMKSKLQLEDQQVDRLKAISHDATGRLREVRRENKEGYSSTADLREKAEREITEVIGREKVRLLFGLVADRWTGNDATAGTISPATVAKPVASPAAVGVPTDTRIVVNDPAFRMDVFENGKLIKSYKIGIGYPEFPLPTGLRKANAIIFNPPWTPPDEPWVGKSGSKAEVGKMIKPGDTLNPLGLLKIPIGSPSLIHGGKSPARIGNFASHGCVGLTNAQAKNFAKLLAHLGGVELTDAQIAQYAKNRTETKTVKLSNPVPVELRYDTITIEDGKLHIYRDVYDRDTNTEQNLRAVLEANGLTLEQFSESERALVTTGLTQMSRGASGKPKAPDQAKAKSTRKSSKDSSGKVTRTIKGQKEVVVEIAALNGKGYPAPVDLDTGSIAKAKKPSNYRKPKKGTL